MGNWLEPDEPEQTVDPEQLAMMVFGFAMIEEYFPEVKNCSGDMTGFDIVFMFPGRIYGSDEVMTAEAYEMIGKFIDRFVFGKKTGRARFSMALTQSKADESISIAQYVYFFTKQYIKDVYQGYQDQRKFDRYKNDHAKVTMEAIIPDLKDNVLPNRKTYRIVFQAWNNHPLGDNAGYTYAQSAEEMEKLNATTYVVAYNECSPYMANEVVLYKPENIYTIGSIKNLGPFKVLEDIFTRIISEQECIEESSASLAISKTQFWIAFTVIYLIL
ncbi:hypothetical protein L596_022655 [Steinernema carpocapsae]|uniref:Uncharacterized protein n=1 Tax=Steinernema carpocapsae TaxID=34508 RepID=A0A4U5MMA4_STECR|nr:hypothetical protein L596_022655 [Steinernema carpocapsae]